MNYYGITLSDPYLYHHGVKGMKWGVRRYQNKDGTLTRKGRSRMAKDYYSKTQEKYLDREYEKLRKENRDKLEERLLQYKPKGKEWYVDYDNGDYRFSKKAKEYWDLHEQESKKSDKEFFDSQAVKDIDLAREENSKVGETIFSHPDVASKMKELDEIGRKMNRLESDKLGSNSYKEQARLFEEKLKKEKDPDYLEYGSDYAYEMFDELEWGEGGNTYERLKKEVKKENRELYKKYEAKAVEVGKEILGEYYDTPYKGDKWDSAKTYGEKAYQDLMDHRYFL